MNSSENLLNLHAYTLLNKQEDDDEIHFHLEADEPDSCHVCGVLGQLVRYGSKDQRYRDLPIHGKPVSLWVVRRRYQCRECESTFRPELHMMKENRMMTERLYDFVSLRSLYRTHSDIARDTGLDEKTVRQFYLMLKKAPHLAPLFKDDLLDVDLLEAKMGVWSTGEALIAQFFVAVWFNNNSRYGFDIVDAINRLDDTHRQIIVDWVSAPFYP